MILPPLLTSEMMDGREDNNDKYDYRDIYNDVENY